MRFHTDELVTPSDPALRGCRISGGTQQSSSQSTGSGQSTSATLPLNLQNPAFQASAGNTAYQENNIANGEGTQVGLGGLNPTQVQGIASNSAANPLVAPVTAAQGQTLGGIGNLVNGLPQTLSGAFSSLNNEMQPGYAASLATSPQTQAAIQSAIAPVTNTFNTQTVPGLQGSFTQAGQRVGSAGNNGSSAFDNAYATAQGSELATEASTAGSIANNAYQTGLNIQANAPSQIANLSSSELNQMISGLNAQALPQLTQQYGISAGTALYQQQMSTILQALGLSTQGEAPSIGYDSNSQSTSTEQSTGSSSGESLGISNPFGSIAS